MDTGNLSVPVNVSVIIPTFNRAKDVVRAVESALAQTHHQWEIIVVDDGSTDDTVERLQPYREGIRYVYQENQGASAAQNSGINIARGEWIAVLASDDVWHPTKLESQFRILSALGNEFGACFTDCRYLGDPALHRTAFQEAGLDCPDGFCALDDPIRYVLAKHPALYVQSLLVKRSLLEKVNGFKQNLEIGEDTDLIFRLSFHTRFCVVDEPLVQIDRTPSHARLTNLYRIPDSAFGNVARRLEQWLQMPELVDEKIRSRIRSELRSIYYSWVIAKLYRLKFAEALKKLQMIRSNGHSYGRIVSHLFYRACRRSLSTDRSSMEIRFEE